MTNEELLKTVPTTRYQGSKRKILPWLYDCVKGYEFHSVLDAFGGSGMVSCLFKRMGKRVTYNDLYRFNQIIGESIVENDRVLLTEGDVDFLLSSGNNGDSFISDNFQGFYYLEERNNWNWMRHQQELMGKGEMKEERVVLFEKLLALCGEYRRVNQWK